MLLAIHLVMIMVFVILGVIFLNGKGAFLIAGYNTPQKPKNKKLMKRSCVASWEK